MLEHRISRDEMLMRTAYVISARGTCPRGKVGVVIARESRIVATGYVGSPAGQPHCTDPNTECDIGTHGGCVRTVHGEANAVAFAAREGVGTRDCDLYTTLAPCIECAKLIINAGIRRVVYHNLYRDEAGLKLLQNSKVKVSRFPRELTALPA